MITLCKYFTTQMCYIYWVDNECQDAAIDATLHFNQEMLIWGILQYRDQSVSKLRVIK